MRGECEKMKIKNAYNKYMAQGRREEVVLGKIDGIFVKCQCRLDARMAHSSTQGQARLARGLGDWPESRHTKKKD